MFALTEIDANRLAIRQERKSGSDHAMLLKAMEHATALRLQSEERLPFVNHQETPQ